MARTAYLRLKGAKTGDIKGSVTHHGHLGQIAVIAASQVVLTPHDPASGQATGRRQHQPLVITKEVDRASVLLHQVQTTNEAIAAFVLDFFQLRPDGTQENDYSIALGHASIASFRTVMPNIKDPAMSKFEIYEEVAFAYATITWTWHAVPVTATDGIDHAR